jgi:hypothetical protein
MAVKFLESHTVGTAYREGETAGFSRDVEADLIKRKIAEAVKPKASKPTA